MMGRGLSALLYPPECAVCGKLLACGETRKISVHKDCWRRLNRITGPVCCRCGKPVLSAQQEYCYDCSRQTRTFEGGHGLWLYDAVSSQSVFSYKYSRKRSYVPFYGESLMHFYGDWIRSLKVQQLIPVPVSRQKKRQRGFNQAELLADYMGGAMAIPVNAQSLVRIHSTAPQKELGREERRRNLEKAFRVRATGLEGVERVLLIDDIYTTGSTIESCARALKLAGVDKIWFLTLCIGGTF